MSQRRHATVEQHHFFSCPSCARAPASRFSCPPLPSFSVTVPEHTRGSSEPFVNAADPLGILLSLEAPWTRTVELSGMSALHFRAPPFAFRLCSDTYTRMYRLIVVNKGSKVVKCPFHNTVNSIQSNAVIPYRIIPMWTVLVLRRLTKGGPTFVGGRFPIQ